jgi:prepilin-type N-terminal cleavage/methylation domain-containing protein
MKKNRSWNAGFTLLEIIIALAITSIVAAAAARFMTSVVSQYTKDNKDIKLQTEVEEILNLMENVIMDADSVEIQKDLSGTAVAEGDSGSVLRVNKSEKDDSGIETENYYLIFVDENNIYESRYQKVGNEWKNVGSHDRIYMGTHVDHINFTLSESGSALFADVSMEYAGVSYDASRKILLRNLTSDYQTGSTVSTSTAASTEGENISGPIQGTQEETTAASASTEPVKDTESSTQNSTESSAQTSTESSAQISTETGSGSSGESTDPSGSTETTETASASGGEALEENSVLVTKTSIAKMDNYYLVSITIENQGAPIKWEDLNISYYYNCPGRYRFYAKNLKIVTDNTSPESVHGNLGTPVELTEHYVNAVGYIPITLGTYYYQTFDTEKTITITFEVGNTDIYNNWSKLYDSENNASYSVEKSYSALAVNHVVVYNQKNKIFGETPSDQVELEKTAVVISNQTVDTSDDKTCKIAFDVTNHGEKLDWSKLEIRYFYMKPARETIKMTSLSGSSAEMDSISTSFSSSALDQTYSDASQALSVTMDGGGAFYTGEAVHLSFDLSYSSGSVINDTSGSKSFLKSHSLKAENFICVYYDGTLIYGTAPSEAAEEAAFNPVIINQGYTDGGTYYQENFTLQNLGGDVNWDDVEVRCYFINPSSQTLMVNTGTYKLNNSEDGKGTCELAALTPAYAGAASMVTMKVGREDAFYTYDSLDITLKLAYKSKANMTNEKSNYGFQNSYSLKGAEYITVYYKGELVWGSVPDETAEEEVTEEEEQKKDVLAVESNTFSYWDKRYGKINLKIKNTSTGYVNMKNVQIRFFYNLPNNVLYHSYGNAYLPNTGYNASFSYVALSKASAVATNYISCTWTADYYLKPNATVDAEIGIYLADSQAFEGSDFMNSYSLDSPANVAIYYRGELVWGSEPTGITYDAKLSAFPTYADPVPEVEVYCYNAGASNDYNSKMAGYYPNYYVNVKNYGDIDWDKLEVCFYQYYDPQYFTYGIPTLYAYKMPSKYSYSFGKISSGETARGEAQWVLTFDGLQCPDGYGGIDLNFGILFANSYGAANYDKTYTKSAETLVIYYDGKQVWPSK